MQTDNWDTAIVPYDFTQVLTFIFDFDQQALDEAAQNQFLSSNQVGGVDLPLLTGDDGFNPDETIDMTNFKNKQASKKIMILKKEIHIEKRRFLISNSFMLLMKMVYEYLKYLVSKKFTDFEPIAKIKDVIMVSPLQTKKFSSTTARRIS
jgi:hypothetical protein